MIVTFPLSIPSRVILVVLDLPEHFLRQFFLTNWKKNETLLHLLYQKTKLSFDFSNCSDMQRMYHILSKNVMAKAFTKAEEIVRKSLNKCRSDEAWSENSKKKFNGCTQELKESSSWIDVIYTDVEKLSAEESRLS